MGVVEEIRRREQLLRDLRMKLLASKTAAEAESLERALRRVIREAGTAKAAGGKATTKQT